uniref:Uncharacterized protein n=1 Tax=Leersia perrieri TaxID=77586 RepID=A0A0D9XYB2_9ORYZ
MPAASASALLSDGQGASLLSPIYGSALHPARPPSRTPHAFPSPRSDDRLPYHAPAPLTTDIAKSNIAGATAAQSNPVAVGVAGSRSAAAPSSDPLLDLSPIPRPVFSVSPPQSSSTTPPGSSTLLLRSWALACC